MRRISQKNKTMDLKSMIKQISTMISSGQRMMEKYTVNSLLNMIDSQKIAQISKFVFRNDQKVELVGFVRGMLKVFEHQEIETLFLVIALVDLYRAVQDSYELEDFVTLKHVTNFVCDSQLNMDDGYQIKKKLIPQQKLVTPVVDRVRSIDVDPPVEHGQNIEGITRLLNNKIWTDNQHHKNQRVKRAHFLSDRKQIVVLDSLSDKLDIYSMDCVKLGEIHPRKGGDQDFIIIDFSYSKRHQRIGSCLMDMSLSFWDGQDNFQYCKNFLINNQVPFYQQQIWYLEHFQSWITTDQTHKVYEWDLESEKILRTLKQYKSQIIDILEIAQMQILIVATIDKFLHIQGYHNTAELQLVDVTSGGIHTIKFSPLHMVLLVAGYCNHIKVFSVHNTCYDANLEGTLSGHTSMISSLCVVQESPMAITSDDGGQIKLWDIRNFNCLQTLTIGAKTVMHTLLDLSDFRRLALVGIRLYVMKFEESPHFKQPQDKIYGLQVSFNFQSNEFLVATRRDVRFFSLKNGRLQRVLKNLIKESDDEITTFKVVRMNKSFLIGNQRGAIQTHTFSGELEEKLDSQTHEISNIKLDNINKLIVITSEASISIQQTQKAKLVNINPLKPHTIRELKSLHAKKSIVLMELSVYHNIIFTTSHDSLILAFDYEFGKLIGRVHLPVNHEPTALQCINGYSMLMIATNMGYIIGLQFHNKENEMNFRTLIVASLSDLAPEIQGDSLYVQRFMCDIMGGVSNKPSDLKDRAESPNNRDVKSFLLYLALQNGYMIVLDITTEFVTLVNNYIIPVPAAYHRMNYNSQRVVFEDVSQQQLKLQGFKIDLGATTAVETPIDFTDEQSLLKIRRRSVMMSPRSSFTDLRTPFERQIPRIDGNTVICNFRCHRDSITSLSLLELDSQFLITSSQDHYIKFWDMSVKRNVSENPDYVLMSPQLVCSINLNHPLPSLWNLRDNQTTKEHRKVLFAMRVVDIMFRKYRDEIMPAEEKYLSLQPLFDHITQRQLPNLSSIIRKPDDIVVMQDEFSQRDLATSLPVIGPSLKQLDKLKDLEAADGENQYGKKQQPTRVQSLITQLERKMKDSGHKMEDPSSLNFLVEQRFKSKGSQHTKGEYIQALEKRFSGEITYSQKKAMLTSGQSDKNSTLKRDKTDTTVQGISYLGHQKQPSQFFNKHKRDTQTNNSSVTKVFQEKSRQFTNLPSPSMSMSTKPDISESFTNHRIHQMIKQMNMKVLQSQRSMLKARFDQHIPLLEPPTRTRPSVQFEQSMHMDSQIIDPPDQFQEELDKAQSKISKKVSLKLSMLQPENLKRVQDPKFEQKVELYKKSRCSKSYNQSVIQ